MTKGLMQGYLLEMIDTEGRAWCADGFATKEAAIAEARATMTARGWQFVSITECWIEL